MQLKGESATESLGAEVAKHCTPPLVIYLSGDLGCGKTTFARGFIRSYGHVGIVKSPTFALIETYTFEEARLYHLDLYRLQDIHELEYLGVRELCSEQDSICLIEWPQRGGEKTPLADLEFSFEHEGENRNVISRALSTKGRSIIDRM